MLSRSETFDGFSQNILLVDIDLANIWPTMGGKELCNFSLDLDLEGLD